MPDTPKCPRHDDTLVHIGDSWLCMQCNYRCNGPALAPTYDSGSRTEADAARFEAAHAERPDRRVSRVSDDEFDLAAEVE